jgi:transcription factor E
MLKKFLKDVLFLVVGKQAEGISELLHSKKHVNEFLIAKKLGITINQTRNILYKISDRGLVSSIRKKDKRKGWYTYFWKIEVLKALEFLKEHILKRMEQINYQIKSRESKQFYICEKCNLEFNEENALLRDFTCRECGNVFVIKDNSKLIRDLKKELSKLEIELKAITQELEKEQEKLDKMREKEIRKAKKEKEKNRKLRKGVKKKKVKKAKR